jgi:hypothetical protein
MPKKENAAMRAVEGRSSDAKELIEQLTCRARDACDLEDLLLNAINSFLQSLPDGKRIYGGKRPIGQIELLSPTIDPPEVRAEGIITIDFRPADINNYSCGVAQINLRNKTYSITLPEGFSYGPQFIKDTEQVMKYLGLRKVKARNI